MMKELLTRRLKMIDTDEEPDLIVIDGGKGQLGMACEVLDELNLVHIPIIGLAKEFEEIYIPNSKDQLLFLKIIRLCICFSRLEMNLTDLQLLITEN